MRSFDASDEATGLPPLDVIDERDGFLALRVRGGEGLVMLPEVDGDIAEPIPVRYLHMRGLIQGTEKQVDWGQVLLAIPASIVPDVIAALTESVYEGD